MGVGFSGNWRGFNFNVGGSGLATPAFGGNDPAAGLRTGFAISGRQGQLNFSFDFAQGYRQSNVSQTPMVTLMNGQQGFFSDTSQTPFLVSVLPVVGAGGPPIGFFNPLPTPAQLAAAAGMPMPSGNPRLDAIRQARAESQENGWQPGGARQGPVAPPPPPRPRNPRPPEAVTAADQAADVGDRLAAAQESSAGRAAPSVAEARRLHAAEKNAGSEQILALMERARAAEEAGKPNVAKIYYQMVARRASGELKQQALDRLNALQGSANR